MTEQTVFSAFVVVTALGLAVIVVGVVIAENCSEALPARSSCPCESPAEAGFTSHASLSGPRTPMHHQQGAPAPGPSSHCGSLSLAYVCRNLAINTSVSKVARLIKDEGKGVSMRNLARGARALGLKVKGLRTDLRDLKTLPKPFIAFFPEWKHFVVVTDASDKGVTYVDLTGPNTLDWNRPDEFAGKWKGEVLVFGEDKGELGAPLTEEDMAQYIGGETCGPCNKVIQKRRVRKCEDVYDCSLTRYVVALKKYGCANKIASMSCTNRPTHRGYSYPCRQGSGLRKCKPDNTGMPSVWGRINACR